MSLQLGGSVCKRDGSRSNSLTRGNELFFFLAQVRNKSRRLVATLTWLLKNYVETGEQSVLTVGYVALRRRHYAVGTLN